MLEINHITKAFGEISVLKGVTLKLEPGLFGLLGPNGAGKSTLMRNIATLMAPDSGTIKFCGVDTAKTPNAIRNSLGYLPQSFGVYPRMSAYELLDQLAVMKGSLKKKPRRAQIESLLKAVNLWEKKDANVATFSGGMRQRFGVAQALLGNPKILIVDEPTAGLDLYERQRLLDLLSEAAKDKIIILSTHITDDIKDLCKDMAIFADGKILIRGEPASMIASLDGKIWRCKINKEEIEAAKTKYQVLYSRLIMGTTFINVLSDSKPGLEFEPSPPDLEDTYFAHLNGFMR